MSSNSLKAQFIQAERKMQANPTELAPAKKMRLYGLVKQVKEGDCKMPMPPASNVVLRSKWDAWMSMKGVSQERAMDDYITLVDQLDGPYPPIYPPGSVRRKGTLFKERDVFKGWRPRHFCLQDTFLHYYIETDDPIPRKSMDLSGCSVTAIKPVIVDGAEYFPFVITHPKSTKAYNLSSDSKYEADMWIERIQEAAASVEEYSSAAAPATRLLRANSDGGTPMTADPSSAGDDSNIANPRETLANIPQKYAQKIEMAVKAALDAVNADGWENLFEKDGIVAKRRPGAIVCVKGDSVIPFSVQDTFKLLSNLERGYEIDPQRREVYHLKDYSLHTWAEYLAFKPIWPTSARDFVNLAHWRLLKDGTAVLCSFSEKLDDLKPAVDGHVRGELILGAYVLKPVAGGTELHYVIQTDLKGSLPTSVTNIVANQQPMNVATIRKILTKDKERNSRDFQNMSEKPSYQEMVDIKKKGGAPVDYEDMDRDRSTGASVAPAHTAASSGSGAASSGPAAPVRSALKNNAGGRGLERGKRMSSKDAKLNTIAMLILLMPIFLYFAVDKQYRAIAFFGGILFAARYLVSLHLGNPVKQVSSNQEMNAELGLSTVPTGRLLVRFSVDLGRILKYLDSKRAASELEITLTHITLKACAMVLQQETPSLNGHMMLNSFYRSRTPNVDVSVSLEVSEKETVMMKIEDAAAKPLECITDEIVNRSKEIRSGKRSSGDKASFKTRVVAMLPTLLRHKVVKFLTFLGSNLGMSFPKLGVTPFPLGVCTVITSPSRDGETDVDIALVPDVTDVSTPITVTIGGIRIMPTMDQERRVSGSPVLNFSVSLNTKMGSLAEGRKFCSRLQTFLSDPVLMESAKKAVDVDNSPSKRK